MSKNYKILSIDKNATELEIKRAYKQLAKKYHPDNKKTKDSKKFVEINKAYEELLNPKVETFFGFEIWESLVKPEDFDVNHFTIYDMFGDGKNCKEYKKYKWSKNKLKLLSRIYGKIIFYQEVINDIVGIEVIVSHFNRLLNKDIDLKEKITKVENMTTKPIEIVEIFTGDKIPKYEDFKVKRIKKLVFDIQNQFHPKFINKFPMSIQIFIRNKIKQILREIGD